MTTPDEGTVFASQKSGTPPPPPHIAMVPREVAISLRAGDSVTVPFTLTRLRTTAAISLDVGPLPENITAEFSPASLPELQVATNKPTNFALILTAASEVPPASVQIEVSAFDALDEIAAGAVIDLNLHAYGQVKPLYQLLNVLYAPPGTNAGKGASQVVYGSDSTTGTTDSLSDSFKSSVGVTASVSGGVGAVTLGASAQYTAAQTTTDTSEISIKKGTSTQINVTGPSQDGINHGHDLFYLWLNPLLYVDIDHQNNVAWEIGVDGPEMLIQYVYADWLRDPSLLPAGTAKALADRGLGAADYAQILARDPFSDDSTIDANRFLRLPHSFPYIPPEHPGDPVPTMTYTLTNSTTASGTQKVETQYGVSVSVSAAFKVVLASLTLKADASLQWTNTSTSVGTTGASQSASVTIGGPSFGYQGPTNVLVYWDTIFSSFMFGFTTDPPLISGVLIDRDGNPVAHKLLRLDVVGNSLTTFTDTRGNYRFYGDAEGHGTISVDTAKFAVVIGRGESSSELRMMK